jgi:hypothetical protein
MTKPPQQIYDYICSNDVTLVLYPPYVGSHNAIASFLTDKNITTNFVYIMSQDIESINSAVGQELPEKLILQYGASRRLTSVLKSKSTILIDCLSMFRSSNMDINLKTRKKDCHIVIFESSEICPTDEQYIKQHYPSFSVLTYLLSPQQPSLSYKLEQTHMTSEQSNIYLTSDTSIPSSSKLPSTSDNPGSSLANSLEPQNKVLETPPDPRSGLEIGNFKYPEEVQHESSTLTDTDRGEGGWLTKSIVGKIRDYSPKISNLLTIIISRYEDKHVVYTQFKDRHGVDLLDTLLKYLNIPHIVITKDDDSNEQIGKISTFSNDVNQKVLLTNTVPSSEISEVTHVHFLEGITESILKTFLANVYKSNLFKKITPISCTIHFHIASLPEKSGDNKNGNDNSGNNIPISIDGEMYTKVANDIIERRNVYERLSKKSDRICFDRTNLISII